MKRTRVSPGAIFSITVSCCGRRERELGKAEAQANMQRLADDYDELADMASNAHRTGNIPKPSNKNLSLKSMWTIVGELLRIGYRAISDDA
jgi:hypothetical protein